MAMTTADVRMCLHAANLVVVRVAQGSVIEAMHMTVKVTVAMVMSPMPPEEPADPALFPTNFLHHGANAELMAMFEAGQCIGLAWLESNKRGRDDNRSCGQSNVDDTHF